MKLHREESISNFEWWSGAKDTVKHLTYGEMERIEEILEDLFPDGIDETELNDLFWFEEDMIAEWLGYENFDEIMERYEQ